MSQDDVRPPHIEDRTWRAVITKEARWSWAVQIQEGLLVEGRWLWSVDNTFYATTERGAERRAGKAIARRKQRQAWATLARVIEETS